MRFSAGTGFVSPGKRGLHHPGLDAAGPPLQRALAPPELFDPGPSSDADPAHPCPAIGAADPLVPPAADFGGTARPQGGASDLGAFEPL